MFAHLEVFQLFFYFLTRRDTPLTLIHPWKRHSSCSSRWFPCWRSADERWPSSSPQSFPLSCFWWRIASLSSKRVAGNSSQFAMSEHDALERVSCDKWIPPWNIFHHKKFTPPGDLNGFFLLNSRILPDKKKKRINSLPAADVCASIV